MYGPGAEPDFYTSFSDHDSVIEIGVFIRPYLAEMLSRVSPYFQICVYTASEQLYADAILDQLDPHHQVFKKRIYRSQCLKASIPCPSNHPLQNLMPNEAAQQHLESSQSDTSSARNLDDAGTLPEAQQEHKVVYLKDLRILQGVDLSRVVIVDNQLLSFALQPDNGIPISSYFFDPADAELRYVADYLLEKYELQTTLNGVADVREVNKQ